MSTGGAAGGEQRYAYSGAAAGEQQQQKGYIRAVVAAGVAVMKIQWSCNRGSNGEEDAMALEQGAAAREIRIP